MDDHYAICAVTKQDERISAERQEMIKYYNNDNGWLNILLKYLSRDISQTLARAAIGVWWEREREREKLSLKYDTKV